MDTIQLFPGPVVGLQLDAGASDMVHPMNRNSGPPFPPSLSDNLSWPLLGMSEAVFPMYKSTPSDLNDPWVLGLSSAMSSQERWHALSNCHCLTGLNNP